MEEKILELTKEVGKWKGQAEFLLHNMNNALSVNAKANQEVATLTTKNGSLKRLVIVEGVVICILLYKVSKASNKKKEVIDEGIS